MDGRQTPLASFLRRIGPPVLSLAALLLTTPLPAAEDSALAQLGERLFNDTGLSSTGTVSCATCHDPARYFTDGRARAIGVANQAGTRNAPSLFNVRYSDTLLWDGRFTSLETQTALPLTSPIEHGLDSRGAVAHRVRSNADYAHSFTRVLGISPEALAFEHVAQSLAAYQRTLISRNSAFDRYDRTQEPSSLSPDALRGLQLFRGRAGCAACHTLEGEPKMLSDGAFHTSPLPLPPVVTSNLAGLVSRVTKLAESGRRDELDRLVGTDTQIAALGHFVVTLDPHDIGKFRTPSLRNVTETAPYMHDGSVATLAEAIDLEIYSRGAVAYPIVLTSEEKAQLTAFLTALTSPR